MNMRNAFLPLNFCVGGHKIYSIVKDDNTFFNDVSNMQFLLKQDSLQNAKRFQPTRKK